MTLQVEPGPATALPAPRFLDAGEAALVVEFGDTFDPAINDRVLAVDAVLRAARRDEAALLARGIVVEPHVRTHFSSEFLLGLNLFDGVVGLDAPG